jgi:hypothetical protein
MNPAMVNRDYKNAGSSSSSLGTHVLEALASEGMEKERTCRESVGLFETSGVTLLRLRRADNKLSAPPGRKDPIPFRINDGSIFGLSGGWDSATQF